MPKNCDVIVIGAGIGGLTAALLLARRGLKVVVFEAHDRPGGAASSWVRKVRDQNRIVRRFVFDAGVQDISGLSPSGPLTRLLDGTDTSKALEWRRVRHRYVQDGLSVDIPETRPGFMTMLIERFPCERQGISALFAEIACLEAEIQSNTDQLLSGEVRSGDISAWASANPSMMRWMKEPYALFLSHFIHDRVLQNLLTTISEYVTEDPARLTVGDMVPLFGYYNHGGFYPSGGTQKLSDTLMQAIRNHGGTVRLKSPVTKILLQENRVTGVMMAPGDIISAPKVIANIDPLICYRDLLGNPELRRNDSRRLQGRASGPSGILVSLGLDIIPDLPARTFLHDGNTCLGIGNPSAIDPSLAPPGHAAVTLLHLIGADEARMWCGLSGDAYEIKKTKTTDALVEVATQAIAHLRRHIVACETATPQTFRRYIRSPDGGIYGAAIGQWSPRTETPFLGLFFAGATMQYGPGVEAAAMSGFAAANQIFL